MQVQLALSKPVPTGLSEELIKKSVYCSPHLKALSISADGATAVLTIDREDQAAAVSDKVSRFIGVTIKGYRKFDRKVVFQNDIAPVYFANAWEELLRRNWAYDSGFGQVALAGTGFDLFRYFEDVFVRMAEEAFRARHYRFPTLIPAEILGRCSYFSSFPHAITFATHLHGDYDVLDQFSTANKEGPLTFPRLDALEAPQYCLTPVVCYHCYRTLQGQHLTPEELRVFTAVGSCFRYESHNTTTLERLWDFTLREIVFVGSREAVKERRQVCMDLVAEWLKRIGLRVTFETASDPFFTSDFSERTYFQLVSDLKYEMRVNVSPERTIAAGSFNLHNDFFGKTFDIHSGNGAAFSSCIGFGVERFVYAFVCQKGFDPAGWPEEVQRFVKDPS